MELRFKEAKWQKAEKKARWAGKDAEALLNCAKSAFYQDSYKQLWNSFAAKLMQKPENFTDIDQFYTRSLSRLVRSVTDRKYESRVPDLLRIAAESRYSFSPICRSFHTKWIASHLRSFIMLIAGYVRLYYCENDLLEMLSAESLDFSAHYLPLPHLLALEIRSGNLRIIEELREAIYGDNSRIRISRRMIEGIIRSGNEDLINDLIKLLKTAGLQEGLRQQILEAADIGSPKSFAMIVGACAENDLFRFSSAVRALGVWTGFAVENTRPAAARRLGSIAYEVLTDEEKRKVYLASSDLSEVWMSLWGYGCHDIDLTLDHIRELLNHQDRGRRLLAWYFVCNTDSPSFKMRMARAHLDERDPEALAWLTNCLAESNRFRYASNAANKAQKTVENELLPANIEERRKLFDSLLQLLPVIGEKKRAFSGMPFHFVSVTLSADPVIGCLMSLAGYDADAQLTRRLFEALPFMSAERRQSLICYFLNPSEKPEDRQRILTLLDDRSLAVKEAAVKALSSLDLGNEELELIADSLKSRSSSFRAEVVRLLRAQPRGKIMPLLRKMIESSEEYKIQAAADLLSEWEEAYPGTVDQFQAALLALSEKQLSTQTEILIKKLLPGKTQEAFTRENGFGLYNPSEVNAYLEKLRRAYEPVPWDEKALQKVFPTKHEFEDLLLRLDAVFDRHADYEYESENWYGSRSKILLGNIGGGIGFPMPAGCGSARISDEKARLSMLPFADEFLEAFGIFAKDTGKAAGLYAVSQILRIDSGLFAYEDWLLSLFKNMPVPGYGSKYNRFAPFGGGSQTKRVPVLMSIMALLPSELDQHSLFEKSFEIYRCIADRIGDDNLSRTFRRLVSNTVRYYGTEEREKSINLPDLAIWRRLIGQLDLGDEDFASWFGYEFQKEMHAGSGVDFGLSAEDIFRAHALGLVPPGGIYARFLQKESARPSMLAYLTRAVQSDRRVTDLYERYPKAREIVDAMVERIADVEEKRGELQTELSNHALSIGRLYGCGHFVNLLAALGRENFYRGYDYVYQADKRTTLSLLLKHCRPAEKDTPELFSEHLRKTDISESRLVEAVMYCPQWAALAEEALGWKGLKSAVWFFHAHINEHHNAEKETEIALYSPVSVERFVDGAFDKSWFLDIYLALGEKRFGMLYKSAKYITSGSNNHKRSQLYSDAVLGKLDISSLEKEIREKRNQERLRAYPLIPIAEDDKREALRRYEFIQQFARESKQFGAQRKESERKAVQIALENLAITTGLMDVNRLMWLMEAQKTDELKPLCEPRSLGDITVRLNIDGEGDASVLLEKDGRVLKTVPKALAKDEVFLDLKNRAKELKEQKRRVKESLETAMRERTPFGREELASLLSNPVLGPMAGKLIWASDGRLGFAELSDNGLKLTDAGGKEQPCGDLLIPAHPHDMIGAGVWQDYMRVLYDRSIIQPFKQVFREYYPITEDERAEKTVSRRYAGYQVNPKRALALLKGRGWTVDYEEGLQRVFYRENLVVRLFALADWFSPADVEAPTLETIRFFGRKDGAGVPLEDIPPVLFSEIMRDIDLVVSVAYVGGVDPETSQSTIEIRRGLAEELIRLLKLKNVRFAGSHARIEGSLANWSVHMGSGIVHAEGRGMIPLIPVHSQSRGRIFLPFADDDPKTAEIMSKIIMLSEDSKIKDPEVLSRV